MIAEPQVPFGIKVNSASENEQFRWIVAQEGSRQTYAVPLSFHRLRQLRLLFTDVWCSRGRGLLRRGPESTRALATRFQPEIPSDKVVSFNSKAILDRALYHFRRGRMTPEEHALEFIRFGSWFAKKVTGRLERMTLDDRDLFFGFNTNCLETLEYLKSHQITTVVDQIDPGKVEEDMIVEEAERWPGWMKYPGRMPQAYWDRLKAEWELGDIILVNSEWSADALVQQGVPREKIIAIPLAIDLSHEHELKPVNPRGTLKVLWLGSVILRKGIPYLVEAARLLEKQNVEFLLAGPLGISETAVQSFPSNIKTLGRITRDQLSEVYRQAHVFLLPTISDGFAITQLEAMAHGLPVITTPNCGRVVTDGVDGFIVPARDGKAIAETLMRLNEDRELLRAMSCNALLTIGKYDLPSNARLINEAIARRKLEAGKVAVVHD